MSYPKKNMFTGKPSRRKLRNYNRIARRRRKRGIYKRHYNDLIKMCMIRPRSEV